MASQIRIPTSKKKEEGYIKISLKALNYQLIESSNRPQHKYNFRNFFVGFEWNIRIILNRGSAKFIFCQVCRHTASSAIRVFIFVSRVLSPIIKSLLI